MPMCQPCDRWFSTETGYRQHLENSSAHKHDDYTSSSEDEDDDSSSEEESSEEESSEEDSEEEVRGWPCEACPKTFGSGSALHQHCRDAKNHPYCVDCKRMFQNQHNLTQHLRSKVHLGAQITCPWCKKDFITAAGLTIHLESGTCSSGIDRRLINQTIQKYDKRHLITAPLLTSGREPQTMETIATEYAWNGKGFKCYFCPKVFKKLSALNNHLKSPAHERDIYRCPKAGCKRKFKSLSDLVQHVESESCGLMQFNQVQQAAKGGIQNMIGKLVRAA